MRIAVHATPGARRNQVGGCHDGALRVSVTAPADKGRANKAIVKELARALGIKPTQLELISGQTHRRKVFAVTSPRSDLNSQVSDLMKQT